MPDLTNYEVPRHFNKNFLYEFMPSETMFEVVGKDYGIFLCKGRTTLTLLPLYPLTIHLVPLKDWKSNKGDSVLVFSSLDMSVPPVLSDFKHISCGWLDSLNQGLNDLAAREDIAEVISFAEAYNTTYEVAKEHIQIRNMTERTPQLELKCTPTSILSILRSIFNPNN